MKALIDVPAQVDVDTSIHAIKLSLDAKNARLSITGVDHPDVYDFSTYFDALAAPDQAVITDFLVEIIAGSFGITPGEVTGTLFTPDL